VDEKLIICFAWSYGNMFHEGRYTQWTGDQVPRRYPGGTQEVPRRYPGGT